MWGSKSLIPFLADEHLLPGSRFIKWVAQQVAALVDDSKADVLKLRGQRRRKVEKFLADRFLMDQPCPVILENVPCLVPILALDRTLNNHDGILVFAVMYLLAIVTLSDLNLMIWQFQ